MYVCASIYKQDNYASCCIARKRWHLLSLVRVQHLLFITKFFQEIACNLRVWRVPAIADVFLFLLYMLPLLLQLAVGVSCFSCFPLNGFSFLFSYSPLCTFVCVRLCWKHWRCIFAAHGTALYNLKFVNATPLFAELWIGVHISYNCFYYPIYKILWFCLSEEVQMQLGAYADIQIYIYIYMGTTAAGLFILFVFGFTSCSSGPLSGFASARYVCQSSYMEAFVAHYR